MRIAVVSTSLNPNSKSFVLAQTAAEDLRRLGHEADLIDLRELKLPFCGEPGAYEHPAVEPLSDRLQAADGILLASAVYNFDLNAASKNLVELTGGAWEGKVVGFLLSAGGPNSYMSVMAFANSPMLDFRCLILPRFVYALGKRHFSDGQVAEADIRQRVRGLVDEMVRVAGALKAAQPQAAQV